MSQHSIPIGTHVGLVRDGVLQPQWPAEHTRVFRHDRNGTYRLEHTQLRIYITAYDYELVVRQSTDGKD